MPAAKIAELAGIEVPAKTKILIAEVTSTDPEKEEFSHEKLSPVLAMYKAKSFQEAVDKAEHLVLAGGPGHTASLYVHPAQAEKIALFEDTMNCLLYTSHRRLSGKISRIPEELLRVIMSVLDQIDIGV